MNEPAILTEDQTVALLRAGSSEAVPPLADPTATAILKGHRMRRRRQAGQVGAGLLATAAACAAVFAAMPGLNAGGQVQTADSPRDSAVSAESARHANFRMLANALGSDFEIVYAGGSEELLYIAPKPGSAAAGALPTGWIAHADVVVAAGTEALRCNADADRADGTTTCTTRTLVDGRQVVIETRSGATKPDTRVELRRVHFLQPDGDAIAVTLVVQPEHTADATVPREALTAWLARYEPYLVKVTVDPAMAPGSIAERRAAVAEVGPDEATAHAQNLDVLKSHLGRDFERENPDAMPPFQDSLVVVKPGRTAATPLPADYGARAHVSVFADPEDNVCDPTATADRAGESCKIRPLPGGDQVILRGISSPLEASVPVEIRHVYYIQPDGDVVDVSLAVIPETLDGEVPREAIGEWLTTYELALISAATDPEMAPGTVAERRGQSEEQPNDVYLQQALGPSFTADGNGEQATLTLGSAAAGELPAGYTAHASLVLSEDPNQACTPTKPGADSVARCETRTLSDGRKVTVQTFVGYFDSEGALLGKTQVFFVRPDGSIAWASLHARGTEVAEAKSRAPRDRMVEWLTSFTDELIAAATDPRVHP